MPKARLVLEEYFIRAEADEATSPLHMILRYTDFPCNSR